MQLFKLKTRLSKFDHFADFAREFKLSEHDLVITNEFLYSRCLLFCRSLYRLMGSSTA